MNLLVVIGGRGDESGHLCALARTHGMGIVWIGDKAHAPLGAYKILSYHENHDPVIGLSSFSLPPQLDRLPNIVGVICLDPRRRAEAALAAYELHLPSQLWGGFTASSRVEFLGELAACGARVPSFRRIEVARDVPAWPGGRMLKPDAPGQYGTYLLGPRTAPDSVLTLAGPRAMYAQRWVIGTPVMVQAALRSGKALAVVAARRVLERLEDTAPAVVVDGHDLDASVGLLGLSTQIESLAAILRWPSGPVWFDMVLTESGPVVLDGWRGVVSDGLLEAMDVATAGRIGAAILASFMPLGTAGQAGYSGAAVDGQRSAILPEGRCPVVRSVSQRYVCAIGSDAGRTVRRFVARMPAERVKEPDGSRGRLSPERVVLRVAKGETLRALQGPLDRLGYVIASDQHMDAARSRAERYAADLYASIVLDQDADAADGGPAEDGRWEDDPWTLTSTD